MEGPARMARQPLPDGRMLVGGVIVEDGVDSLSGWNLALDGIQKCVFAFRRGRSWPRTECLPAACIMGHSSGRPLFIGRPG